MSKTRRTGRPQTSRSKRNVRVPTPKGVQRAALPKVNVRRVSLFGDGDGATVNINFFIELPNLGNSIPENLFKNFHIIVVQCTSQKQSDSLKRLTAEMLSKTVYDSFRTGFGSQRIFSIDQKQLRNLKDPAVSEKKMLSFSLDEEGPFKLKTRKHTHLSYIFVPFLNNQGQIQFGTPTIEVVFNNGRKITRGHALVDKNTGRPHTGHATTTRPSQSAAVAARRRSDSAGPAAERPATRPIYAQETDSRGVATGEVKELEVVEVPNITIQDNTIWTKLKIDNSSFQAQAVSTIRDNPAPTAYDPIKSVSTISDDKKAYFSDLSFSKSDDQYQSNKIMLSINFKKMATDAALYPWLIQNSDQAEQIIKLTKIKSLKVIRRCTKCVETSTPLGMATHKGTEPTEEKVHIVAQSADESGRLKTKTTETSSNNQTESTVLAGSISEIKLISDTEEIRSFAITDNQVNSMGGKHQYGIEVEIEEATKLYLNQRLRQLQDAIGIISLYMYAANRIDTKARRPYWDEKQNKFTSTFESQLQPPHHRIGLLNAITTYLTTLSDLTSKIINVDIVAPELFNLIAPENGTMDNILRLVEEMRNLQQKIHDMATGKKRDTVSKGEVQSMRHKAPDAGQSLYKTWFDDLYNSSADIKNGGKVGYKFLPIDEEDPGATSPGPPIVAQRVYEEMIQQQHNRIFKVEGNISITEDIQADISSTKPTYLSPVSVRTEESEIQYNPRDIASRRTMFHDVDKYSEITTDALKHNMGIGIENRSTRPQKSARTYQAVPDKQRGLRLIDNLIDLYSSKGCTVEGISSFSSQNCEEDSSLFSRRAPATTKNVIDKRRAPKDKGTLDKEAISMAENNNLNPKKALMTLAGSLTPKNNSSWRKRGIKNSDLNLKLDRSKLKSMPTEKINDLPNQINALMAMATSQENEKALTVDTNKLNPVDKDNNDFYQENFANLRQVNMLVGFETVNGESQMKKPIYKKLKQEDINSLPAGQMAFCKTTIYENVEVGIERNRELELPVYNEAFVLKSDRTSETINSPRRSEVSRKTKERREVKNPERATAIKIDPASIYTDGEFIGTNPDNSAPKIKRRTPRPKRGRPPKERRTAASSPTAPTSPSTRPTRPRPGGPMTGGSGGTGGGY